MSEATLLIAYRAMPSSVLEERIQLMRSVLAERHAQARAEEVQRLREDPYVKPVTATIPSDTPSTGWTKLKVELGSPDPTGL